VTNPSEFDDGSGPRCHALLIETDESYRAAIAACMELAGCRVEQEVGIESAFVTLERHSFDLIVWGVSPTDGDRRVEVMGQLRLRSEAALIVVDADTTTAQFDLEGGADQWLPKPFVPGALVGSIRASLRKTASTGVRVSSRLEIRGMVLDGGRRRLTYAGSEASFTRQEWDLLSILIGHPDRFLGAQEIIRLGWRAGEHAAEQLRTYVHRLRNKLEPLDLPCHLLSQHGQGYCLTFSDKAAAARGERSEA
jgi:DNA-binding response OmpR family regulator